MKLKRAIESAMLWLCALLLSPPHSFAAACMQHVQVELLVGTSIAGLAHFDGYSLVLLLSRARKDKEES